MPELPAPPVPVDLNLKNMDGFLLNVERLLASELWAISTGEEFKAAMGLWCRAWKQVPAASLPDDDRVLAQFSGTGKRWPRVRDVALRGFVRCSDGRLYHLVLATDAMRAAGKRDAHRTRAVIAANARWKDSQPDASSIPQASRKHPPSSVKAVLGDAQYQYQYQLQLQGGVCGVGLTRDVTTTPPHSDLIQTLASLGLSTHPEAITEWRGLLDGPLVNADDEPEACVALVQIVERARKSGVTIEFARHVTATAVEIQRERVRRTAPPPAQRPAPESRMEADVRRQADRARRLRGDLNDIERALLTNPSNNIDLAGNVIYAHPATLES